MNKSRCLSDALKALRGTTQALFNKMPVLFLVLIYLIDLGIRSYISAGWSSTYLLGILILFISVCIYVTTKSFSETTLSFILGILTIYSINWEEANFTLFIILYLAYIIAVFYISVIRLNMQQESILTQAACKLDIDNFNDIYKRLKKISQVSTTYNQLSIIDKCEIIRYLSFRQVIIGEYEEAANIIELIKGVCQIELMPCCEIYYGLYTYCYNQEPIPANISKEVKRMFDKITTLTISYVEFFEIFAQTKRILVEKILSFDKYIVKIKLLSMKGYNSNDIIELMKKEYFSI